MANQFLGLSLFVMLLSFFIILNAISSFETTKTQPVLNSLTVAFSNKRAEQDIDPGLIEAESETSQLGSTLDRIQGLFESQITAVKAKQNRLGTSMVVKMPFADFQKALRASLTIPDNTPSLLNADTVDLQPMLVSLLETGRDITYKMDMLLHVDRDPADILSEDPQRFANLERSIASVAQSLEEAGLPRKQVSAGMKQGDPGVIELVFTRYLPFNPLGTGTGADAVPQPATTEGAAP